MSDLHPPGVRLAGVNTAIYSPSGGNSGVGFAIPIDELRRSVEQIIQYGKVVRPILGISFAPDQSVEQVPPQALSPKSMIRLRICTKGDSPE